MKAVVIACGTATSQALDAVKELYDIPIIGIIEPAAKSSLFILGRITITSFILTHTWGAGQ